MPSNVEIKARIANIENLKKTAAELSKSEGELIVQEDTFFVCTDGRLKLRQLQVTTTFLSYKILVFPKYNLTKPDLFFPCFPRGL